MRTPTLSKKPTFKKHPLTIALQACAYTILGGSPLAVAAPTGGAVVGGSGTISQSGTATTINQATQNLAINWQSFDVAANERVQFIQPNASAIALNTILSNNGTTIAGRIDSNGQVILVNANGIFFTSTSVLNVGSIIASGLGINPAAFMNGNYVFNEIPGTSGVVINSGTINASLGGNVALIGKRVENNGLIVANLGTVTLAAGKQAVLTFDSGGLLGVRVSQEILQNELGVDPAVLNSGEIQAQGGRVLLTASQSQDVFSRAVNNAGMEPATSVVVNDDGTFTLGGADVLNSGSINTSATSAGQSGGRIVLIGENVTSSGTLKADAASGNGGEIELHANNMTLLTGNSVTSARSESNGNGGIVKVLGDKVGLFDQSTVDVSGANGGGQALIGGDFQGNNTKIRNSSATIINPGASVYADALQNGNGGKVIAWSDGSTYFLGNISVRGGSVSGDGGFVETSGKEFLRFDGYVDRTAANGASGMLLLDPKNLTIQATGNDNGDLDGNVVTFGENGDGTDSTISATALVAALSTGDVTLQANNDITFSADVSATGTNGLTLQAGRSIFINSAITLSGGFFMATINHDGADTGSPGGSGAIPYRTADAAVFSMGVGSSITTNGGNITIDTGTFGGGGATNVGTFTLQTLNSSGLAAASGTGNSGGAAGILSVTNDYGDIAVNGQITALGGAGGTGAIGNPGGAGGTGGAGGNIALTANSGSITVGAAILSSGGAGGAGGDGQANVVSNGGAGGTGGAAGTIDLMVGNNLVVNANIVAAGGVGGAGGAAGTDPDLGTGLTGGPGGNGVSSTILLRGDGTDNIFTLNNVTLTGSTVTIDGGVGYDQLVRGGTATDNTWRVDGPNSGNLVIGSNAPILFTSMESLTGGSLNDEFIISGAGSLSGMLSGGTGSNAGDILRVQTAGTTVQIGNRSVGDALADPSLNVINIGQYFGSGDSTLRADNNLTSTTTWLINGSNSGTLTVSPVSGVTFSGFNTLVGGTGADDFTFIPPGRLTNAGSISGGSGLGINTLTVNSGTNSAVTLDSSLATLGSGNFAASGFVSSVGYSNINDVTVNGGANIAANNVNIGGTLTLANITGAVTSTGSITAGTLVLSNVGPAGALPPLNTTIGNLSILNSGPVNLINTGGLILGQINTANTINITAGGNITNSAGLSSSGTFTASTTGNITLSGGSNTLSGPLNLTGATVSLANNGATVLGSVTANTLSVNSTGSISDTGLLVNVAGDMVLTSTGGAINLTNVDHIASGSMTANSITLNTAAGVGTSSALNTATANLTVTNTLGAVNISNTGPVSASVITAGDINFTNNGTLTIRQLNTLGGRIPGYGESSYGAAINLTVNSGAVYGTNYVAQSPFPIPDIVAQTFVGTSLGGDFGAAGMFMNVMVKQRFDLTAYGRRAYIQFIPTKPAGDINADVTLSINALGGIDTRLLEVDSLDEFDPAIFTEIRNYYYEDVAIMMPADQRLDATDEEEKEKEEKL